MSIARLFDRLSHATLDEVIWRARAAGYTTIERVSTTLAAGTWRRESLNHLLVDAPGLRDARLALRQRRWDAAHRALTEHIVGSQPRFAIAPAMRSSLAAAINGVFPDAAANAAARGERIVSGWYDLLGYQSLRFDAKSGPAAVDWHYDPVHDARPPRLFWSQVPYLDARCGDHKVIWELNRHQHWLTLGRAFWLTADTRYRTVFINQLDDWMRTNPPLLGINWASMLELGLRSVSWLWALNFFVDPTASDRVPWTVDLLIGLDRQLRQIERHLSLYFSPNTHLLGEALALYVVSRCLPEFAASRRRESRGRQILVAELARQLTSDGGYCERSTHYHRYALDFYLLALVVARATDDPVAAAFERGVARLADAARLLTDDSGQLPHIGDDDGGAAFPIAGRAADDVRDSLAIAAALTARPELQVAPPPEEAYWLLAHPKLIAALHEASAADSSCVHPSGALRETGFYVSRSPAGDHLVIDGGPHGYMNGGHAHADALSLTFTLRGMPLLIDPGTGCYTTDARLRDRLRSSLLHNVVAIDGRSQSAPRGPFHWTHTANSSVIRWRANDAFDYFDGTQDGYAPLVHRRRVLAIRNDLLIVADLVEGEGTHAAAAHWHLDPRWDVAPTDGGATMTAPGRRTGLVAVPGNIERLYADPESGLGWYSPVYGRLEPTTTLRVVGGGTMPLWLMSVFWIDDMNPATSAALLPVWGEAGRLKHGTAARIVRQHSHDYVLVAEPAREDAATRWRAADIETDARALFCSTNADGVVTRLLMVDGSFVRVGGRHPLQLVLPRTVPDFHVDLAADANAGVPARIAGPQFGGRLTIGGRERHIDTERRPAPPRISEDRTR